MFFFYLHFPSLQYAKSTKHLFANVFGSPCASTAHTGWLSSGQRWEQAIATNFSLPSDGAQVTTVTTATPESKIYQIFGIEYGTRYLECKFFFSLNPFHSFVSCRLRQIFLNWVNIVTAYAIKFIAKTLTSSS